MTLAKLQQQVDEINRGEYEHWAFDPRVDRHLAVTVLRQEVSGIAWQSWAKAEAHKIMSQLSEETSHADPTNH